MTKKIIEVAGLILGEIKEAVKKYGKLVIYALLIFLVSYLVTIPLAVWSINKGLRTPLMLAGVIRAACLYLLWIALFPALVSISVVRKGWHGAIDRTIRFMNGTALGEIVICIIAGWLPFINNTDMIFPYFLLASLLGWFISPALNKKVAGAIVLGLFFLTIVSLFFPYSLQAMGKKAYYSDQEAGMPQRVDQDMTCTGFERDEYMFIDNEGNPVKYYVYGDDNRIKAYEPRSKNANHTKSGELLFPFTPEMVLKLKKQICDQERAALETRRAQLEAEEKERTRREEERKKAEEARASGNASSQNNSSSSSTTTDSKSAVSNAGSSTTSKKTGGLFIPTSSSQRSRTKTTAQPASASPSRNSGQSSTSFTARYLSGSPVKKKGNPNGQDFSWLVEGKKKKD